MQIVKSKVSATWNDILQESAILRVKQLMKRVEQLACKSQCPELKVAYLLIDKNLNEVTFAVNKYKSKEWQRKHPKDQLANWLHAEKQLALRTVQSHVKITEFCAIGNFSPCRYCVLDLNTIGVRAIVFSNLYWDTPALELAEKLGMKLFYFSGSKLHFLTHSVILGLSGLNITPIKKYDNEEMLNLDTSICEEERNAYTKTHGAELINLLNILLTEFLKNDQRLKGVYMETKISKLLSQVDTEQECLRWAKRNIILRRQPW